MSNSSTRLTLSCIAVVFLGCGDSLSPASNEDIPSISGLWRFAWMTDGKDDADVMTVELSQDGPSVSGRGCSTNHEDRSGSVVLASVTCSEDPYEGSLRGKRLSLTLQPLDTSQGQYTLDLTLNADETMLQGTGQGLRCMGCAIAATRTHVGDGSE